MLIYLGLCAVACFAGSIFLLLQGETSRFAAAHLVFAVGIMPLIFGAIAYFVPVLTRSGAAPRHILYLPLLLQLAGVLLVGHFLGWLGIGGLHAAAGLSVLALLAFVGWLLFRVHKTLGKPHPGWRWYLAAIACLMLALLLVPLMPLLPGWRPVLRLLHLHLNVLGFIGLTALGTLQVLLPTILSGPDADAAARLRRDLPLGGGAVLAVALGAAFWWPFSLIGAALLLMVIGRLAHAWWRRYGWGRIAGDGAAAALALSLAGLALSVVLGALHAPRLLAGSHAVFAFISLFLLPLVSGALSQLLPVWRFPGPRCAARDFMRSRLCRSGLVRSLLFVAGGLALALGLGEGVWLVAAGLVFFLAGLAAGVLPLVRSARLPD